MVKNNKGFMLAEVIIVSTVVITAMVSFYASFNKIYGNYKQKDFYYSINATYALRSYVNYLIESNELNDILRSNFENENLNQYALLCDGVSSSDGVCSELKNLYNVQNIYLVEYDKAIDLNNQVSGGLKNLRNSSDINATFGEYIDYLVEYYSIDASEDYSFLFLIEILENDTYKYANLRLR